MNIGSSDSSEARFQTTCLLLSELEKYRDESLAGKAWSVNSSPLSRYLVLIVLKSWTEEVDGARIPLPRSPNCQSSDTKEFRNNRNFFGKNQTWKKWKEETEKTEREEKRGKNEGEKRRKVNFVPSAWGAWQEMTCH